MFNELQQLRFCDGSLVAIVVFEEHSPEHRPSKKWPDDAYADPAAILPPQSQQNHCPQCAFAQTTLLQPLSFWHIAPHLGQQRLCFNSSNPAFMCS